MIVTEPPHAPPSVACAVPNSSSRVAVHVDVVTDRFGGSGATNVGGVVSLLLTVTVTV